MRLLLPLALLLLLAGCAEWDWKRSLRSALESACNSVGNCAISTGIAPLAGWLRLVAPELSKISLWTGTTVAFGNRARMR